MLWKGDQSPKVKKERKPTWRGKWESVFSGQCSKGDSCTFSHDIQASGNSSGAQRRKGRSSSPASHSKAKQTDGEGQTPSEESGNRDESLSYKRSKIPSYRNCNNPSCCSWHPPVSQNCKSETGCKFSNKCFFDMLRRRRSPAKSQRKVVRKDQLLY